MAIKTFSVGEVLTASDTNTYLANAGLVYVTSTAVGTGSTLTISNCFSSTYNSYRIVFDNLKCASGVIFVTFQLRAGSTTNTAGYYDSRLEVTQAAAVVAAASNNSTGWTPTIVADSSRTSGGYFDLYNPYNTVQTSFVSNGVDPRAAGAAYRAGGGWHDSTTSFDSIVFTASTNFSTGTVTVYGYRKA